MVAGLTSDVETDLFRYNVNGNLDATFGTGGRARCGLLFNPSALAVQADGRIIVSSTANVTYPPPFVIRFDPHGTLDASFGTGGMATVSGINFLEDIALQSDGKILLAAYPGVPRLLTNNPLPSASQRFVAHAYLDLLKRTADPAGLGYWSHLLDQGMATAEEVVADIEATPEYRAIEVQQVFGLLLNRAATSSELNAYGTFLASGGTVEQAEAAIAGSAEYFAHRAGMTNNGFLDALYADALGRAVDSTGRQNFGNALATGTLTRGQVAAFIFDSREYFTGLVESFYLHFLHRPADSTGLTSAVNGLETGALSDEAMIASLVGSAEYAAQRT